MGYFFIQLWSIFELVVVPDQPLIDPSGSSGLGHSTFTSTCNQGIGGMLLVTIITRDVNSTKGPLFTGHLMTGTGQSDVAAHRRAASHEVVNNDYFLVIVAVPTTHPFYLVEFTSGELGCPNGSYPQPGGARL